MSDMERAAVVRSSLLCAAVLAFGVSCRLNPESPLRELPPRYLGTWMPAGLNPYVGVDDIGVNSAGTHVFMLQRVRESYLSSVRVQEYGSDGVFVGEWMVEDSVRTARLALDDRPGSAFGLCVLLDRQYRAQPPSLVVRLDDRGRQVAAWPVSILDPVAIAVEATGEILVSTNTDSTGQASRMFQRYSPSGSLVRETSISPQDLAPIEDIKAGLDGSLYVLTTSEGRPIVRLDRGLEIDPAWTIAGVTTWNADRIAVDSRARLYAPKPWPPGIVVADASGAFITRVVDYSFYSPRTAVDGLGTLYATTVFGVARYGGKELPWERR